MRSSLRRGFLLGFLVGYMPLLFGADLPLETTILHLKNGDRLAGKVISEDQERIVLSTDWNAAIFVPLNQIAKREIVVPVEPEPASTVVESTPEAASPPPESPSTTKPTSTPATTTQEVAAKSPPQKPSSAKKGQFLGGDLQWDVRLGFTLRQGAKESQIYYGGVNMTYARSYRENPRKFLRNRLEYRLDYEEADGEVSANKMMFYNKTDFDIGTRTYAYNILGAGYDRPRKIDLTYELGPGGGYHFVNTKRLALDGEVGLNFQRQDLVNAPHRDLLQLRLAQQLTWEIVPKVRLDETINFLPSLNETDEYQIRAEVNLGVGVVSSLSIHFTVLNLYDSMPARGVPNNDFQFRSSLGVKF